MTIKQWMTYSLVVLLFFGSMQEAWAQKKKKKNRNTPSTSQAADDVDSDALLIEPLFLDAHRAKMLGDMEKAMELYKECLKIDDDNDAVLYELAKIHFEQNDGEKALEYARQAVESDGDNKWYLYMYAEALGAAYKFEEAAAVFGQIINLNPETLDAYFEQAYMYKKARQYELAIQSFDKLEERIGIEESIVTEKQRLYMKLNQPEKAAAELEKLIAEFPKETRYYTLLADLYAANGREEEAMNVYKKLLEVSPDDPLARMAVAVYYKEQGDYDRFYTELQEGFKNPALGLEVKVGILMDNYAGVSDDDEKRKQHALHLSKILMDTHPEEALGFTLYGDFLNKYGKKEEALESYQKSLELDENNFNVWQQVFFMLTDLGHFEELAKVSKDATALFPNQPLCYYFSGMAHSRLGEYEQAAKVLKKGTIIGTDNDILLMEFYSLLGECYNSSKQFEKSDKYYDKALNIDASNSLVLNNYGYYLSLREEKLEKAEQMSLRSNELEPNNASFQDTYAWILYKLQRYEEARVWIEKSMSNSGSGRPVIVEHYGDILYKLGDIEGAVENWQKALDLGAKGDKLNEKIANKKLLE